MRTNFFLAVIGLSLALYSCDKDNDEPINEEETLVKTEAEAAALVNAAYVPLQWLNSYNSAFLEGLTEVLASVSEDVSAASRLSRFEVTTDNDVVIELFSDPYTSVGAANLAIAQIEAAPVSASLTQEQKDYQIARAKFVRGHSYFKLVQTFGEAPILTTDAIVGERKPVNEVYQQAVNDLTEAAEHLPAYDAQKSNPSKAAANTILAKLYLTWGQIPVTSAEIQAIANSQTDPAKPAPDAAKLQKAVEYADAVIANTQYHLLSNFNNIWGVSNENNAEVIFSVRHDGDGIDDFGNHQTHCGFTWPKNPRTDPHLSYADVTLKNRIPDGDGRKFFSYVTQIGYADGTIDTLDWPVSVVRPGKWIHRTANDITKALEPEEQLNNIDRIDYRFAEVLLIKAEALFFQGNAAAALPLVNQLRERAYGNNSHNLSSLTAQNLYDEWDKEFAFELKRWFNLVRWRNYISTVKTALDGFEYIKSDYTSTESINAAFPNETGINYPLYVKLHENQLAKKNGLKGKLYRLPIPLGYEYEDLGITPQNPGY
ncbi:MAG: RagB/SusD family nutrient uptake outer membrane protein [Tannerellaceae bacterium]|jgi:hypothetical protein|nr:RagB/SusD family nutrient uptake outer membrane protein [Tannerellaceae bacterium]